MPLQPGQRLGPYEIVEPIGKGGMGEVYRATDTRLGRPVAIKVSIREFDDRFQREAQAISSLNHPNVCTLYDVGSTADIPGYLVMEFVEGETLAERLVRGPLSLEKTLSYAGQIADALAAAHAKGIIHRDLKPGNIIVSATGVKVLDFGLAKLRSIEVDDDVAATGAATAAPITGRGVVVGTPQYMAPEQVQAQGADERSDIFAFGAVLYEMITGRRAFTGDNSAAVMASVIKDDPPSIRQLRLDVPRSLDRLVHRCLEKNPDDRWQSARDLKPTIEMIDLDAASVVASGSSAQDCTLGLGPSLPRRRWVMPVVATLALVGIGAAVVWLRTPPDTAPASIRFELPVTDVQMIGHPNPSPDGRWLVFRGRGLDGVVRLWLRALDSLDVRPLEGTETENPLPASPFWSPDSRSIAFASTPFNFTAGQLKRVAIAGGPTQVISDIPGGAIGTWNQDDVIVFGATGNPGTLGLRRVSASGGQPVQVTTTDPERGETLHWLPQFLPDGRRFLYFVASQDAAVQGVYVGSLDLSPAEQSREPFLLTSRNTKYVPGAPGGPGWLLFVRETTLFAQRMDSDRLALTGPVIPVADQVGSFPGANAAFYDASDTGVLAYALESYSESLILMDQQGRTLDTILSGANYSNPALSPDETRVAFSELDPRSGDSSIWVLDLRTRNRTKVTFRRGRSDFPVWSPDGTEIAYASNESGWFDLYRKNADASGEDTLLVSSESNKAPTSWSRTGYLLYDVSASQNTDVWLLPIERGGAPRPYLSAEYPEYQAQFSRDGAWVAYVAQEASPGIYVRRFSADPVTPSSSNERWLVSEGMGYMPRWNGDGTELYYLDDTFGQTKVDIRAAAAVVASRSSRLFTVTSMRGKWSVTGDGQRFLHSSAQTASPSARVIVATNWLADLEE